MKKKEAKKLTLTNFVYGYFCIFLMQNKMSSRQEKLSELQKYIKEVDKEVTMILQSLQWDRKKILQSKPKSTCKYESNHKVPVEKLEEHESRCALKSQGYADDDIFLPNVFDANSNTVLKLSSENIKDIINYASKTDPVFNRGDVNVGHTPQTAERLQATYTADERRAIYDVVIHSRPACDELADLAVGEAGSASQPNTQCKSKLEVLAELRDMRRRRAKYKVAARSTNYSHMLRGLIDTQMEMYTEAQDHTKSHDESHRKNLNDNEELSDKSLDNAAGSKTYHREFDKDRIDTNYDKDRRNNYSEHKRKRDYDDKYLQRFDKHRYPSTMEERGKQHDSYRRHERNRDSYRDVGKDRYRSSIEERRHDNYDRSKRQERNRDTCRVKMEKDVDDSTEDREKHYNSDKRKQERNRGTSREEMDCRRYDKSTNVDSKRIFIKEERDSSSSRDIQRYRDSEREESYYNENSRDKSRSDREHKPYDDKYKKQREYSNYREIR